MGNIKYMSRRYAMLCAYLYVFFIPISPALMNMSIALVLFFVLMSGGIVEHFRLAWNNPVARAGLLFFSLFLARS